MIERWWTRLDRTGRLLVVAGAVLVVLAIVALVASWDTYWSQYVVNNVFPPSLWTLLGIGIAHVRTHRKLDAQHEAMKQHVTRETSNG
jgi:hypothetical protein